MTSKPLVSVVVPSYNHEKYIEQCITSIINQTYPNIQLIVIDDGSSDNSPSIIQNLAAKHNFQFVFQKNIGLPKTKNKAIKEYVKGKYVCGLASDDFLPADSIAKRVEFMENNQEYAAAFGRIRSVNSDSQIIDYHTNKYYKSGRIFDDLLLGNFWIPAPATIIKKEVFDIVGLYNEELVYEDYYMWLKISEKFPMGFIDDYLTYYRIHGQNFHLTTNLLDQQKIIYDAYSNHSLYSKAIAHWHYRSFLYYCKQNNGKALKHLIPSIRYFYRKDYIKSLVKFILYGTNA